ncbi:hypothetical protein ACIQWA_37460 [Kitasatospora sp. NPDC098652]|uniref:hypothetical protein n=1 Tax=Kitasatospora sp. NPDC098652 TaxID=3364095 RepID=UPI00381B95E0
MPDSDLLSLLIAETGDLRPGPDTTPAELTDLRRALLAGAPGGPSPSSRTAPTVDEALRAELDYLIAQHASAPRPPGPAPRLIRREGLPAGVDPSAPDRAVAQQVARTFGPFLDRADRRVWFDLFQSHSWLTVHRGPAGPPILALPPASQGTPGPGHFELPGGTVWIAVTQLVGSAPGDGWVGLRVRSGTLDVDAAPQLVDGQLTVPAGADLRLNVILDPPAGPGPGTGPLTGPGAEAADTTAGFPVNALFLLEPSAGSVSIPNASLTVYGSSFTLRPAPGPPAYDQDSSRLLIPFTPTPDRLAIARTRADLFTPSGTAALARAAWALPVVGSTLDGLGEADGTGKLLLSVKDGLTASWPGLDGGPAVLGPVDVLTDGRTLSLGCPRATARRARQEFRLWRESEPDVRSSVAIGFPQQFPLRYGSVPATDVLMTAGTARAHLDRPRSAAGEGIDAPMKALCVLVQRPGGSELQLNAAPAGPQAAGRMALSLANVLLSTTAPSRLTVAGPLAAPDRLDSGTLTLDLGLLHALPMLPDPYTANFTVLTDREPPAEAVTVQAKVAWPDPATPDLTIGLSTQDALPSDLLPPPGPVFGFHPAEHPAQPSAPAQQALDWLLAVFDELGQSTGLTLLDLSSNSDQLGVSIPLSAAARLPVTVKDLMLNTSAGNARIFLLPQFHWETVHNLYSPMTGDADGPLHSGDDGLPALVLADSVTLVPLAPVPLAEEVVRGYRQDAAGVSALFTLPFGLIALAELDPHDRRYRKPPELDLQSPDFAAPSGHPADRMTGARQLSLRAGVSAGTDDPSAPPVPLLGGATKQLQNLTPGSPLTSVLGLLASDFNPLFRTEVPLNRIELGGYGANVFSRWVNDSTSAVTITQVAFDAFHGRTAFERVQFTTILWPCQATLVRTITLERHGNAAVVRFDSGWLASTPGLFHHPKAPGITFHPGVVRGLFDIREIRDTSLYVDLDGAAGSPGPTLQAVYFDADVEIDGLTAGGANGRVPAHRHLGFVQRIPLAEQVTSGGVGALTPGQLQQLFALQGPLGGPVDCTIRIGDSPHLMRVTGVHADSADQAFGQFAVAVHGAPALPAPGQWSVVRVEPDQTVTPVDAQRGVPLIRRGEATATGANPNGFRFADPAHLFDDHPDDYYALLFASETQRILYPRPKIDAGKAEITSVDTPRLANPYALLRAGGLFPPPTTDAIPFDASDPPQAFPLTLDAGQLRFAGGTVSFPAAVDQLLVNAGSWTARTQYASSKVLVESDKDWRIVQQQVEQHLRFEPLGEILTIVHDIDSPTAGPTDFPTPAVELAGPLQPVAEVMNLLNSLVPSGGTPGLPGPLQVSLTRDGTAVRLSAVADFAVAQPDGQPVECGFGKLLGHLKVGADIAADLLAAKSGGSVFLEITGSYQQLIFPEIYGGGLLRFKIGADQSGATTVELDACAAGSVGGTLIPGLIDLEAGVKYGYFIGRAGDRFQPGIVLGMDGRATLLSGLLGFSFSVDGHLDVDRVDVQRISVRLHGDILVAGTVTAAWLVKARKSFHTAFDVTVDWQLVAGAAKAGLIPVP